jgi:DNA-binding response OmpR family regulator
MPTKTLKKILIAEDERPMAKAMALKLTRAGFDVTTVSDGNEALSEITNNSFDLVITDLMMPKIDGFKLLELMNEQGIVVPVIVTSNLSQEEDAEKIKELGAKEYFIKSNTPIIQIVDHVKKILKV